MGAEGGRRPEATTEPVSPPRAPQPGQPPRLPRPRSLHPPSGPAPRPARRPTNPRRIETELRRSGGEGEGKKNLTSRAPPSAAAAAAPPCSSSDWLVGLAGSAALREGEVGLGAVSGGLAAPALRAPASSSSSHTGPGRVACWRGETVRGYPPAPAWTRRTGGVRCADAPCPCARWIAGSFVHRVREAGRIRAPSLSL